jgi:hypothetical protein
VNRSASSMVGASAALTAMAFENRAKAASDRLSIKLAPKRYRPGRYQLQHIEVRKASYRQKFILVAANQLVLAALDRVKGARELPKLRRNYVRFRASDSSIHDVPFSLFRAKYSYEFVVASK